MNKILWVLLAISICVNAWLGYTVISNEPEILPPKVIIKEKIIHKEIKPIDGPTIDNKNLSTHVAREIMEKKSVSVNNAAMSKIDNLELADQEFIARHEQKKPM